MSIEKALLQQEVVVSPT